MMHDVFEECMFNHILVVIIAQASISQAAKTGLNLTKVGDRFYYFEKNNPLNWYRAEKYCRSYGLALVALETATKSNLLMKELTKQGFSHGDFIWTSGTDAAVEGSWYWSQTAKPFNFKAWSSGEPNNANNNENCLMADNSNGAFIWNDSNCETIAAKFVCELPIACWL